MTRQEDRDRRLAEALRDNLRKRKAQARGEDSKQTPERPSSRPAVNRDND